MTDELASRFNVNAEDIERYNWQSVIADCPNKDCLYYYDVLFKQSRELAEKGDDVGRRVFAFVGTICSFHANYDATGNPYGPLWRSGEERALMAEDLTDADLQALADVLSQIGDADLRARVGDILWECRRDHKAARIAVEAFLESAKRLQTGESWPPFAERLERALQLSAKLGLRQPLYEQTLRTVEEYIAHNLGDLSSGLLCARLMGTLISFRSGDPHHYAVAAERFATELAKNGEWDFAEEYWWVASRWHRRAKREEDVRRAEMQAAETMIAKAEANLRGSTPSCMFAAHWLGRGFEALRQARAPRDRIEQVHIRFLEVQKLSTTELKAMEINYDDIPGLTGKINETAERSQEHVKGKTFEEAIFKLAFVASPTNPDALRARVREHAKEFVFSSLFPASTITRTGKVTDVSPGLAVDPKQVNETAEIKNMFLQARQVDWQIRVAAQIEPARQQIVAEHPVRLHDLRWLLTLNAFIPPDRAGIYARGLQAGFHGDWLVAMHLLIPQLEASIRAIFEQRGTPTSSMQNGIQQEHDLGWLLNHANAVELFGPGMVFDLRGLLTEDFGWNLRHDQAHGLITESDFYCPASPLVWWLTLRLCCIGHQSARRQVAKEAEAKMTAI